MRRLFLPVLAMCAGCMQIIGITDLVSDERPDAGVTPPVDAALDASDGGATEDAEASAVTDAEAGPAFRRVFVTSGKTSGNIGGLAAATGRCNDAADKAGIGLDGGWVAFLSGNAKKSLDELPFDGPYQLLDGRRIAANKTQLATGDLSNPIDLTETMVKVVSSNEAEKRVWTGTGTNRSTALTCNEWASSAITDFGTMGWLDHPENGVWLDNGGLVGDGRWQCNTAGRLYCFER